MRCISNGVDTRYHDGHLSYLLEPAAQKYPLKAPCSPCQLPITRGGRERLPKKNSFHQPRFPAIPCVNSLIGKLYFGEYLPRANQLEIPILALKFSALNRIPSTPPLTPSLSTITAHGHAFYALPIALSCQRGGVVIVCLTRLSEITTRGARRVLIGM